MSEEYVLKAVPEDFVVDEIPLHFHILPKGPYQLCRLKKTNLSTPQAIHLCARMWSLPEKLIGYAGMKDKHALTTQYISVKTGKNLGMTISPEIGVELLGHLDEPICLGDLFGNKFSIIIRKIKHLPKTVKGFPNLYGEQRFSHNNVEIGKYMVQGDLKKVGELLIQDPVHGSNISKFLVKEPGNIVAALHIIPTKTLKIYVHSFQSYLWNLLALEYLTHAPLGKVMIPLIGFGTDSSKFHPSIGKAMSVLMNKENITPRSFIIKKIPRLSSEGGERMLMAEINSLQIGVLEIDDIHAGYNKVKCSFQLEKGAYATEAIRFIMGTSEK